jgi:hypothetical protein
MTLNIILTQKYLLACKHHSDPTVINCIDLKEQARTIGH